ncbi:unnamed protein product [Brassicogethes aeneus]|uniref:Nose resistant-to-fluoxetine protein N-terminal domain-containing protein n=1 Tax=Brassicogethes aeneus TaxID=1431903 RepID=A0A9P0FFS2_BRAAE|nr:unnamed protein product [Brassicogethes aeneus]
MICLCFIFFSLLNLSTNEGTYFNGIISHFGSSVKNIIASYNLANVSVGCKQFYMNYSNEIENIEKFVDSSTKIPSSIIVQNPYDLGDFDECMNINGEFNNEQFRGKYCLTILPSAMMKVARCVPSMCSNDDVANIFNETVIDSACYTYEKEHSLGTGAWITIALIIFLILLSIASSAYELYLLKNNGACKHDLLLAFSAVRNTKQIFQTKSANQLLCINGLKAICMIYVVFHHTTLLTLQYAPLNSIVDIGNIVSSKFNIYMFEVVLVDYFLFAGGLLVALSFMKNYDKNGKKFQIKETLMSFIHRYIRLTPVFAIVILFYLYLVEYFNEGPLHNVVYSELTENCEKYWWSALTHIQNFYNPGSNCLAQSWYIAIDMQLYVLSPFYLILLCKYPKFAKYITAILLIGAIAIPFCISYFYELPYAGHLYDPHHEEYIKYYYLPTYSRYGPYLLGILCGKFIYKIKKNKIEYKLNTVSCITVWILTLTVIMLSCLGPAILVNEEKNIIANSLYNSTYRILFPLAMGSVILLCITGNGNFVNSFLSLPIFQILTKLSYSMYIVHYAEIVLRVTSIKTIQKITRFSMTFDFFGDFIITCILSYFCVILFESPFMVIDKHLFSRNLKKKSNAEIENTIIISNIKYEY